MGLFSKFKAGLAKTHAKLTHEIKRIVTRDVYKRQGANRSWRLVGIAAEGTLCHKPSTVSGGGKSEISKPITDAILTGPVFVADFKADFDRVSELVHRDYSGRFSGKPPRDSRPVFAAERSLGSVLSLIHI